MPLREEEAVLNPLLEGVVVKTTTSPRLSPLNENSDFDNPLLGLFSSRSSSFPQVTLLNEGRSFVNPLLEASCSATSFSHQLSPVEEARAFKNPLLDSSFTVTTSPPQLSPSHSDETPLVNPLLEDIASATSAASSITNNAAVTENTATANIDGDQEYDPASAPCPGFVPYDPEVIEYYTLASPEIAPSSPVVPHEIIESSSATTTTTTTTISPPFLQRVLNLVAEELATIDFFASTAEEAIATGSAAASSSSSNDDTTSSAAAVKIEAVEEPDWESVHQQGEELHMPSYQRRFENRPLETRVFLLDPDSENRVIGSEDEEIGREIDIKREPGI